MREVLVMAMGNNFIVPITDDAHEKVVMAELDTMLAKGIEGKGRKLQLGEWHFRNDFIIGYCVREHAETESERMARVHQQQERLLKTLEKQVGEGDEWRGGE